MSKPRDLSRLFTNATSIATDSELISTVASASANTLSAANIYTDTSISSFEALPSQSGNEGKYLSTDGSTTSWEELDLNAAIVSASTAAYASASAYTDSEISNIDLTATIITASAAAYASASAYTDSQISNIDLSATIQTASAAAVTYLVDSAPSTLDTLNELAQALGDDENFSTTVTNSLAGKLSISSASATYLTQANASATYATIADVNTSLSRWSKIYSASATTISGVDDNANNLDYTVGFITLFINGILQDPSNYTASSGSTIVLNDAVLTNDVVEVLSYKTFNVANTYTTSEIDSKVSNYTRWVKTLSGSATVISGVDDNSNSLLYTIGNEEVYINGILLKKDTDYTTTSASVITLTEAALENDTVEIINFSTINIASVYTKTESDNKYLTLSSASSTYLGQSSASSTYLTQSSASSTYLTQSSASTNYLTQSSASSTYASKIDFPADAWISFSPTVSQSVGVSRTVNYAKYKQVGKTVHASGYLAITSNGSAGANVTVTLPVTAASSGMPIGSFIIYGSSGNINFSGVTWANSTTTMAFRSDGSSFESYFGNQPNRAIVNIDSIAFSITYEAA